MLVQRLYPLDLDLAAQLAARRRAVGLSQNAVALSAGLTEGAIAKYETARVPIAPDKRAAIERVLADAEQRKMVAIQ